MKSSWLSDILSLESKLMEDFFNINCRFSVGNRNAISFWWSQWLEVGILKDIFPILFLFLVYMTLLLREWEVGLAESGGGGI